MIDKGSFAIMRERPTVWYTVGRSNHNPICFGDTAMAVKQHTASAPVGATKACSTCGENKPLVDFYRDSTKPDGRDHRCKICKKGYSADWRNLNLEKCRQQSRENMRKLRQTEEGMRISRQRAMDWRQRNRERYLELRREESARRRARKKAKQGIFDAHVQAWKRRQLELKKRSVKYSAHVTAFNVFKKTASDGWHARHWKKIGQPWRNPRLTPAQKFRIQYALDAGYRLYHINKAGWRRDALLERNDGTINFRALLKERKTCPYCGCKITRENAVADHMDPLKHGGNNSQHNLTICCRDCNTRKSGRPFAEWLDMLTPERRTAARRWYVHKQGRQPEQQAITFAFTP